MTSVPGLRDPVYSNGRCGMSDQVSVKDAVQPAGMAEDIMFSPIQVGPLEMKNRLVMASTTSALGDHTGAATARNAAYLARRAAGGVGMIVTEALHIHPTSMLEYNNLRIDADGYIKPLAKVAKAVQENGARLIGQLIHVGRQWESATSRLALWAPSQSSAFPVKTEVAHEMDLEQIREIVDAFGAGARRLAAAGFDGVEIHAAHGFLIQQFMSPISNFRSDAYGGGMDNRLRFLFEVIEAVRRNAGQGMVVGLKFSATEMVPGGLTLDGSLEIVRRLDAAEGLDYYLVSAGGFDGSDAVHPTCQSTVMPFIENAAAIKQVTEVPVIAIGKIKQEAGSVIAEGKADMVAMARPLICDPDVPKKLREERQEDIRSCLSCNECHARIWVNRTIGCAYNPEAGHESEPGLTPAATRKRVVVVGGGPAGCEAARVAAERGHEVILLEKGAGLGGRVGLAAMLPGREDFAALLMFYATMLDKLGVEVRLETEAAADMVRGLAPDAVVVATGTRPGRPGVPGMELPHVHDMDAVLAEQPELGDRVVVYDEEYHVAGLGTAELLADQGRQVTLITPHHMLGPDIEINTHSIMHRSLVGHGVTILTNHLIKEVGPGTVLAQDRYGGGPLSIADVGAVVICNPGRSEDRLYGELKGGGARVHLVGDAFSPRRVMAAVRDGYTAARDI